MKTTRLLSAVLVFMGLFVLYACGGGGGGDGTTGDLPPTRPTGDIVGTAFDGLIINGNVNVYDFSAGVQGALLGSTKTNGEGKYGLSIQATDKPIVIVVTDGYYIEEATGIQIQLDATKGHKLKAVQYYVSGTPITVSATFLTTVATGLAEYLVKTKGMTVQSAILAANQRVSGWAGFNIQMVTPVDVTDPVNATASLTQSHKYGLCAAAISEFTRQVHVVAQEPEHGLWPSIEFIQKGYDDIRVDGTLDGRGTGGQLSIGDTAIGRDTYRWVLAKTMLQFVVGDRNKTSLTLDDVMPFATEVNVHEGPLFDNTPTARNITKTKPVIEELAPANGSTIVGKYNAVATITDDLGITSVEYFVNGNSIPHTGDPAEPSRILDTYGLKNGSHTVTIKVTNVLGNITEQTVNVTVANGLPAVSRAYLSKSGLNPCEWSFDVTDGTGLTGLTSVVLTSPRVSTIELGKWISPTITDTTVKTALPINSFGDVAITVTVTAFNGNTKVHNYVVSAQSGPPSNGRVYHTCTIR